MKRYDTIIIDVNNLFMRNYHVYTDKKYQIKSGKFDFHSGGIYGSLVSLRKLKREKLIDGGRFFFLADNPTSKHRHRKNIDPEYKANRVKKKKGFYRHIDFLVRILSHYDDISKVVRINEYEADDLVPMAIEKEIEEKDDKKILLVSTDMDWARCMNYNGKEVDWFDGKEIVDARKFVDRYGFKPDKDSIIVYKAFHGDTADCIPNPLKGFPKKYLVKFSEEKDVETVINNINLYGLDKKWIQAIQSNKGRILLNRGLVSFVPVEEKDFTFNTVFSKFDYKVLSTMFDSLHLPYNLIERLEEENLGSKKDKGWFEPMKRRRV